MRFADPLSVRAKSLRVRILFAASQRQGSRPNQEDYFGNFNDECFTLADGLGGLPHGEVASKLACETAIWAYREVRLRPYYWADKKLFLKRIFRSTNITLWQKQREKGFEGGMATTLIMCIMGEKSFWAGGVGDGRIYHLGSTGKLTSLLPDDVDPSGKLTNALGVNRYGLVPHVVALPFGHNDCLLLATDGVWRYTDEQFLAKALATCGETTQSLSACVEEILRGANENGSTDNMTVAVVKRMFSS
ncbi:serine/threonine-protein phosphatase [Candidatus Gottesmanbacteria bacterium]|nr:serine/threonine-protein phosphatase [Candidatus Gottesmanbacteria bacterium]